MKVRALEEQCRLLKLPLYGLLLALVAVLALPAEEAREFSLTRVTDGVYAVTWSDPLAAPVDGNSVVIINDEDVLVVDTHLVPSTARAVIAEIRRLTDKPVRFVVNTHWHDDHNSGNQAYLEAFPQATIIAQRHTDQDMRKMNPKFLTDRLEFYRSLMEKKDKQKEQASAADDPDGDRALSREIAYGYAHALLPDLPTLEFTPASLTFDRSLHLRRGKRTIQILHLGRGNTRGDTVVYLPEEKVLVTGDLLVHPIPFSFGSYLGEWIRVLNQLEALDVDVIIPGHGPVLRDNDYLLQVKGLLQSVLQQTKAAADRGLSLEETRKEVDLEAFRIQFGGDDRMRNYAFRSYFITPAVKRGYEEAVGELTDEEF
jgi:glyoxylase-like metal-dependent hydrolase (beta-lactamase superfamily II)